MQQRISWNKSSARCALLLIDMQHKFVRYLPHEVLRNLVREQTLLIRSCEVLNVPVIVVEYCGYGDTIPVLKYKLRNVPRVRVFKKQSNSAFGDRKLIGVLRAYGCNRILVTGINRSACVLKTILAAIHFKFSVHVLEKWIADNAEVRHDQCSMEDVKAIYAVICS